MALIEARALKKTYAGDGASTQALRDVSLAVAPGEFVALMGPSGSGKSTLLHVLGLLDRPTSGTYRFGGQSMGELSDDALATVRNEQIGFVFQMFNLLPRTSVLENVKLPLLYAGLREQERDGRAREALAAVGMTHRLAHAPAQLSGGERQRVAIARALVNRPKLILADEPTGNLDSASGQMVLASLEALHRAGHTIVLVTHETYLAEYAQRIVLLRDGLVVSDRVNETRRTAHEHFQK